MVKLAKAGVINGKCKQLHKVKMVEGWNYLKLIGTTESGVENTTVWKKEYNKEELMKCKQKWPSIYFYTD